ncbi:MAG: response regulator transcription factor [Pedobacter sp.]|nr:MAG: response regulator transcription factor [Pedobacter sp.]
MLTLCIVEDDSITSEAISNILNNLPNYTLAGIYSNAEDYINDFLFVKPDITLMDITLPGITGIQATAKIKQTYPFAKIIMLTNHEENEELFNALKAGADGYVLKKESFEKLPDALDTLKEGGAALTPLIAKKIMDYFNKMEHHSEINTLTDKEKIVLKLIADGLLYKEIADAMNLSLDSIKKYASSIYQKLHVRTRSEAIKKYLG